MIRVVVAGALGRMGREVSAALHRDPEIEVVGGVDPVVAMPNAPAPGVAGQALSSDLAALIDQVKPNVLVDFTHAEAAIQNIRTAIAKGVSPVVGTSGITPAMVAEVEGLAKAAGIGAFIAPNFAIGANLLIHFARIASKFMGAGEIIELHHDGKIDAPSGTAMATAQEMVAAKGSDFADPPTTKWNSEGARGAVEGGVRIHSVRLPGLVAHQEVIFGGPGQILTIRHDSISRDSFMPGIVFAVKEVSKRSGLVYGLDRLMGLG
jgi:4-hydroxy-tetrahydrodipicolinate reductase